MYIWSDQHFLATNFLAETFSSQTTSPLLICTKIKHSVFRITPFLWSTYIHCFWECKLKSKYWTFIYREHFCFTTYQKAIVANTMVVFRWNSEMCLINFPRTSACKPYKQVKLIWNDFWWLLHLNVPNLYLNWTPMSPDLQPQFYLFI